MKKFKKQKPGQLLAGLLFVIVVVVSLWLIFLTFDNPGQDQTAQGPILTVIDQISRAGYTCPGQRPAHLPVICRQENQAVSLNLGQKSIICSLKPAAPESTIVIRVNDIIIRPADVHHQNPDHFESLTGLIDQAQLTDLAAVC